MSIIIIPQNSSYPIIYFDITKDETHVGESTVTENPVETGAIITDHIINKPTDFIGTVVTSNFPMPGNPYGDGQEVTINGTQGFGPTPGMNRVQRTWQMLETLRLAGEFVDVETSLVEYVGLTIVKNSYPMKRESFAEFQLTFKLIILATSATVAAPQPKELRATPAANLGNQNPLTAPFQDLVSGFKTKSIAFGLVNGS